MDSKVEVRLFRREGRRPPGRFGDHHRPAKKGGNRKRATPKRDTRSEGRYGRGPGTPGGEADAEDAEDDASASDDDLPRYLEYSQSAEAENDQLTLPPMGLRHPQQRRTSTGAAGHRHSRSRSADGKRGQGTPFKLDLSGQKAKQQKSIFIF